MKNNIIPTLEIQQLDQSEALAKQDISILVARKAELKDKKSQLEKMFLESDHYKDVSKQIKEFNQAKTDLKKKMLKQPHIASLSEEIKELNRGINEKQLSLFEWLLDYNKATGNATIQDFTGLTYEIAIEAKIKI